MQLHKLQHQRALTRSSRQVLVPGRRIRHVCKVAEVSSVEEELALLRKENELLKATLLKAASAQTVKEIEEQARKAAKPVMADPKDVAVVAKSAKLDMQSALEAGIVWPQPNEQFWRRLPRSEPLPVAGGINVPVEKDSRSLHVVHITAEMAPIAKVGGLGDVVTGLAKACLARGHNVSVILPFYECLQQDLIEGLKHEFDFEVPKGFRWDGDMRVGTLRTSVFWGKIAGCPVYLIRPADWNHSNIFRGNRIYGGAYNEMEAYLYFCRASLEFLKCSGHQPHIIQLHDWHAAAAAMLYWEIYSQEGLWKPRVMLTIHNLDNTGECRQDEFHFTAYPGELLATPDKALDERTIGHNPERLNLMKGGMVYSNAITTVSPTYAREVLEGGAAGWLRDSLSRPEVRNKFHGILNGIDTWEWDPSSDQFIAANYSAEQPMGKALCKRFLQQGLGMAIEPNKPLVAVVSRLVPQKGIHLIKSAVYRTVQKGGQFVLLGSGHSDGVFKGMANGDFANHPDCKLVIMYSEALAHMIYAAADIVVVPSMFEPCGLTQMIALRYGAVPVVRRTGGLADTVFDVDSSPADTANGYVFDGSDEASLHRALDRALLHYQERRESWNALSLRNMREDVSWALSAKSYVGLYESIADRS